MSPDERTEGRETETLARLLSIEERLAETSQRVENTMRNFVELSRAVRSLAQKTEQQEALLRELQARLAGLGSHAGDDGEHDALRRRVSDEDFGDSSVQPLIESALHIQRGEYEEAVRCLEAARQVSDNPKLEQALRMARAMLEIKGSQQLS